MAPQADIDVAELLDPQLRVLGAIPASSALTPEELAADLRSRKRPGAIPAPRPGVERELRVVPGEDGNPDFAVRVFRRRVERGRRGGEPVPGYLWLHGGGYIAGTHDDERPYLDKVVEKTGCVAFSVEYRLAPETPYPGPLEDCWLALKYLLANAEELGVDPARVAIGGASAGGGLAAGLALLARDSGVVLTHQHLLYPMLDDRFVTVSSSWMVPIWTPAMNRLGWQAYLGPRFGSDDVARFAAPARAEDLRGAPPCYLHVGALDGFLHEDIDYAARLAGAGVATELHVWPGAPHAFDALEPGAEVSRAADAAALAALCRVLTP